MGKEIEELGPTRWRLSRRDATSFILPTVIALVSVWRSALFLSQFSADPLRQDDIAVPTLVRHENPVFPFNNYSNKNDSVWLQSNQSTLSEGSNVSTIRTHLIERQYATSKVKNLKLLVAKTISFKDINETVLDLSSLMNRTLDTTQQSTPCNGETVSVNIQWKFFCYNNQTYDALLERVQHWDNSVEVFFEEGRIKPFFWNKHLNPNSIPEDADYLWIMDGDIVIRNMAWQCFWNIVLTFQPGIVAPALMSTTGAAENRKHYVGSTHPHWCYDSSGNDFQRLIAMDTGVVEQQVPMFTRDAWQVVYETISEKVKDWGNFESDWGPDIVWCKVVDYHLFNNQTERDRFQGRPAMKWGIAKKTCSIIPNISFGYDEMTSINQESMSLSLNRHPDEQHPCMIIHATPVMHLDTKSIGLYKSEDDRKKFQRDGDKTLNHYKKAMQKFFTGREKAKDKFYRAYVSNDEACFACQDCKHFKCYTP